MCQTFNFVDMIIDTLFNLPATSFTSASGSDACMSEEEHLSIHYCSRVALLKPLHDGSICLGRRPTGQKASRVL